MDMLRTSISWLTAGGMSEALNSRRVSPVLSTIALAPMLSSNCRVSSWEIAPSGAAPSTSAAVRAAASRSESHIRR